MASTKSFIRPLLCLVLVITPAVMAVAAFEPFLQKLEAARTAAITLEADTDAQNTNINVNSPSPSEFTTKASAMAALDAFIVILNANKQQLLNVSSQALSHMNLINAANHSVFPYTSYTKLADFLLEAKTKSVQQLGNAKIAADTGCTRYVAILYDINLQKTNIANATTAEITAVVIEAKDEFIEAIPDGSSRLEVARVELQKTVDDLNLRLQNVAAELRAIINPDPTFSAYLDTFKGTY